MGVVVAILGRFSAFCPGTARGTDHTHFLNNHLRLFAGEQFYPFFFFLKTEGHPHVSIQVLSNTGELIGTATTNIENGVCLSGATYGAHFFDFGYDYCRYCGY